MKANTTVNIQSIANMLLNTPNAQMAAAYELKRISDPYVPFMTGDLSGSAKVINNVSVASLEYDVPYANYIYQGKVLAGKKPRHTTGRLIHYNKTMHPMATAEWDKAAINNNKGALERVVAEELVKNAR